MDHCQRALHAEVNAVAHAARSGASVEGCRVYIYRKPIAERRGRAVPGVPEGSYGGGCDGGKRILDIPVSRNA